MECPQIFLDQIEKTIFVLEDTNQAEIELIHSVSLCEGTFSVGFDLQAALLLQFFANKSHYSTANNCDLQVFH